MKGGFVYILQSNKNGQYYIGVAFDPSKRLLEHNNHKVTATKYKAPWTLKFNQYFQSIKKAKQIEYKLKKLKRRDIIERIIADQRIITGCSAVGSAHRSGR